MKLYWSSRSPFVRKAMVVAHEAGVAERIEKLPVVVGMGMAPTAEVMRHNPLNKIPTLLTDDGMVLFESVLVCEYLDSLNKGSKLFPADPAQRWPALRWHALGSGMLEAELLWRSETRKPQGQQSAQVIKSFDEKVNAALDVLEAETPALGAAPFSIGHVGVACALAYLDFRFTEFDWRAGHPKLAAWFAEVSKRPSMQATAFVDA